MAAYAVAARKVPLSAGVANSTAARLPTPPQVPRVVLALSPVLSTCRVARSSKLTGAMPGDVPCGRRPTRLLSPVCLVQGLKRYPYRISLAAENNKGRRTRLGSNVR